jgi:hypothetical protein
LEQPIFWICKADSAGNLALSRALGDFEFKQNFALSPETQIVTADPEFIEHDMDGEEEFIVLACDGELAEQLPPSLKLTIRYLGLSYFAASCRLYSTRDRQRRRSRKDLRGYDGEMFGKGIRDWWNRMRQYDSGHSGSIKRTDAGGMAIMGHRKSREKELV